MALLEIMLWLMLVVGVIYMRTPKTIWIIALGAGLLLISIHPRVSPVFLCINWLLYASVTLFVLLKPIRLTYFSKPFIHFLQKRMPSISHTEREAIEAGNVWWEKELFCGRPQWKQLLTIPKPTLSQEEQDFLNNQVNTVCEMMNDWEIVTNKHDMPATIWEYLKKERFLGLVIPKEYGGRGFSALLHSTVVMKIATRSLSTAVNMMVPNSLGPGELLLHYGTEQQKKHYLPKLATGEEIPCFALTAPEAGSDAGSITDAGIVCRGQWNGEEVIGIRLNWDKRYITLAPIATLLGIAFRLYDPEYLLGDKEDIGITLALIPTHHPGIDIGHRHIPLHLAFMNGPTRGKDVFIPLDWIIGGIERAGDGWRMLMECLSIGRAISLPALSTACGKLSYRMTGAYARLRRQFNLPIAYFEGVEEPLACIAGYTYTLEATRIFTAGAVDLALRPATASAIAKYHLTELSRKVLSHAMDVHAGHQIQVGPRNFLAHAYMALPISITVEGANILTRNLIIFGQGAIRCHPYILDEVTLFSAPDSPEKTQQLDRLLLKHMGYTLSNKVRTFWRGLTGGLLIICPKGKRTRYYYQQLTRMSSALAFLSDMCMLILGGQLKRKERLSARLGDILSQLYIGSAILKYQHDQGNTDADMPYIAWSMQHCLYEIQTAIDDLLHNFPQKWIGKCFHFLIFPWGRAYHKPNDSTGHAMLESLLKPCNFRDRLTQDCFISTDPNDAMHRIEYALSQIEKMDPLLKKYQHALRHDKVKKWIGFSGQLKAAQHFNLLTEEEANSLQAFHELYQEVIRVNEFSFDLKTIVN